MDHSEEPGPLPSGEVWGFQAWGPVVSFGVTPPLKKCLFISLAHLKIKLFFILPLSCKLNFFFFLL